MSIYSNTYSPMSFPRENSQSTDATNSNDFRRVVVTLKSQKSAKRRIHSEALHVRVHLHDLLVPHNVFGSLLANCRSHMLSTVQDIWAWITRARSREHYTHDIFWLIFVNLQSPPSDKYHYPFQHRLIGNLWENSAAKMSCNRCSRLFLIVLLLCY